MDKLNNQQVIAVTETEGPMLVLAGAGSGKTKVLTKRVAHLVRSGVHPLSILAITFTNKAAREMRDRIENELQQDISHMWISTFHSMCVRILRISGTVLGYTRDFAIYDSDDSQKVLKKILENINLKDDEYYKPKLLKNAISKFKNSEGYDGDAFSFSDKHYPMISYRFSEIYDAYQKELKHQNAVDFDDLLLLTHELFSTHPEVLDIYRNRFRYVLVDEYQDTNMIQYRLVKMLSGKYRNIFVVGDDDQSIYAFRGANIQNILNFEKDFPGAKVVKLEQNYRSDINILNVANSIIRNNEGRKGKKLWSEIKSDHMPYYYTADSEYAESEFIARTIRSLVSDGASYSDFAVLYRLHTLSRNIEEKLRIYSIPYNVYGGTAFYERREIKDILAYLNLIINPYSELSFSRIINVPKRGIGSVTLAKIIDEARVNNISCIDVCRNADSLLGAAASNKISLFTDIYNDIAEYSADSSIHDTIEYVIEKTGYRKMLLSEYGSDAQLRYENLNELINSAYEFEDSNDNETTLSDYMQSIALLTDMDTTSDNNAVTLMTMHAAKGLEFDTVFVCGMEENLFPSQKAVNEDNIEEERRLCYVSVTRAKNSLYLLNSAKRNVFGDLVYNVPSRFIDEIEPGYIENISPRKKEQNYHNKYDDCSIRTKNIFTGDIPFKVQKPKTAASNINITPGVTVKHKAFGEGIVESVSGTGDQAIALVNFKSAGKKKMFLAFAPLEVL